MPKFILRLYEEVARCDSVDLELEAESLEEAAQIAKDCAINKDGYSRCESPEGAIRVRDTGETSFVLDPDENDSFAARVYCTGINSQGDDGPLIGDPPDALGTLPLDDARPLLAVVKDLLKWADITGGWEAPCWNRAKELVARMEPVSRPSPKSTPGRPRTAHYMPPERLRRP